MIIPYFTYIRWRKFEYFINNKYGQILKFLFFQLDVLVTMVGVWRRREELSVKQSR